MAPPSLATPAPPAQETGPLPKQNPVPAAHSLLTAVRVNVEPDALRQEWAGGRLGAWLGGASRVCGCPLKIVVWIPPLRHKAPLQDKRQVSGIGKQACASVCTFAAARPDFQHRRAIPNGVGMRCPAPTQSGSMPLPHETCLEFARVKAFQQLLSRRKWTLQAVLVVKPRPLVVVRVCGKGWSWRCLECTCSDWAARSGGGAAPDAGAAASPAPGCRARPTHPSTQPAVNTPPPRRSRLWH